MIKIANQTLCAKPDRLALLKDVWKPVCNMFKLKTKTEAVRKVVWKAVWKLEMGF
jgi:beta-galactosidase beta subunit